MKKAIKAIAALIIFFVILPGMAGWAVCALWNSIVTAACGFAAIGFWQGVGLFVLGQIMTGGIVLALFLLAGSLHAFGSHHDDWGSHWHSMTDEQRRDFIERRRKAHFGFRNRMQTRDDVTE